MYGPILETLHVIVLPKYSASNDRGWGARGRTMPYAAWSVDHDSNRTRAWFKRFAPCPAILFSRHCRHRLRCNPLSSRSGNANANSCTPIDTYIIWWKQLDLPYRESRQPTLYAQKCTNNKPKHGICSKTLRNARWKLAAIWISWMFSKIRCRWPGQWSEG